MCRHPGLGEGDVLRALGKNDEALAAYNRAIELSPIYSDAWYGRGEAQKALGKVIGAGASFYLARIAWVWGLIRGLKPLFDTPWSLLRKKGAIEERVMKRSDAA